MAEFETELRSQYEVLTASLKDQIMSASHKQLEQSVGDFAAHVTLEDAKVSVT